MVVGRWLRRKRTGVSAQRAIASLSPELFQRPITAGLADEFEAVVAWTTSGRCI
jgi:hypothetical protein